MDLVEGKMVLELVPTDRPMKGGAVERIAGEAALEAVLFAGDDVADLDAFAALDRLSARGLTAVKVAVRGPETPAPLLEAADLQVEGPEGLVALLRDLLPDANPPSV
jgi:trehalose 6-phosphate phosphatase